MPRIIYIRMIENHVYFLKRKTGMMYTTFVYIEKNAIGCLNHKFKQNRLWKKTD